MTVVAAAVGACSPPNPKPNVVFIVVDALRQDHVGIYGESRPTSPNIDKLAERGVVFEDALTPAPWTLPSVSSLMTGMYPQSHGATCAGEAPFNVDEQGVTRIAAEIPTLAEHLTKAGYRCEGFTANAYLDDILARGFVSSTLRSDDGSDLADFAIRRLTAKEEKPLFLYLHFMEPHDPILVADENFLDIALPGEAPRIPDFRARSFMLGDGFEPDQFRSERLRAYGGAIRYVDRQVGKIVDAAARTESFRQTLFVVTADHGEEIYDHRQQQVANRRFDPRDLWGIGHGHTLYAELLRIPLIVAGQGLTRRRIPVQVSLLDVAPTVLDMLGLLTPDTGMDGRSLRPVMEGTGELAPRGFLASHVAYGFPKRAWITAKWHLIVPSTPAEPVELFDRQADPRNLVNVAATNPEVVKELTEQMDAEEARTVLRRGTRAPMKDPDLERVRAVGYSSGKKKK